MDPHQVPYAYLVHNLFGGHIVFPDTIDLANVGLYLDMIGLEVAVNIKHGLQQAIYVDGAIDMHTGVSILD